MTRSLVYIDCETTGLDLDRHEIWEIAFAVDDEPIRSQFVTHRPIAVIEAHIEALKVTGYVNRGAYPWAHSKWRQPDDSDDGQYGACGVQSREWEWDLRAALAGATLVGANPAFDAAMLRARWGVAPWHYRLLDIEAMGVLGWDEIRGLAAIAEHLGVAAPDHTAAGDVHTLRECHRRLRDLATGVGVDK